jgi:hypothetical protein
VGGTQTREGGEKGGVGEGDDAAGRSGGKPQASLQKYAGALCVCVCVCVGLGHMGGMMMQQACGCRQEQQHTSAQPPEVCR